MLRVDIHTTDALPQTLLESWDAMAEAASMPYSTPEWVLASWRHYRRPIAGTALRIITVHDGDELIAVAPFVAERRGLGLLNTWAFPGIGQRHGPVARAGRADEAAGAIAVHLAAQRERRPSQLLLWASDAASPWGVALRRAWPARRQPQLLRIERSPGMVSDLRGGPEAWLSRRSSGFRKELRRKQRRVAERGAVTRRIDEPAELLDNLDALFTLHAERFERLGRTSSVGEAYRRALREATYALAARGRAWLIVTEAGDDEGVVAADLFVAAGDRVCAWNGGVAAGWERESLGLVQLAFAAQDAAARGAESLDFGSGGQRYKSRLTDRDEPLVTELLVVRDRRWALTHIGMAPVYARRAARGAVNAMPHKLAARLSRRPMLEVPEHLAAVSMFL